VLERLPEDRLPPERLREMFLEECIATRARRAHDALVAELKKRSEPKIETYAEAALESLPLVGSEALQAKTALPSPPIPLGAPARPAERTNP
jgi:hypothetical protein